MVYLFLKHLVFQAVLLRWLNWKTGDQSLSFPHLRGFIWTSCIHFWLLTSWCTLLIFSLTNKKIKINCNNEKSGQSTGQALWFLLWDQQRQIFGCTLWTSQGQTREPVLLGSKRADRFCRTWNIFHSLRQHKALICLGLLRWLHSITCSLLDWTCVQLEWEQGNKGQK